jgi:Rrf2 family transcriptional regulator, cysteine metabolism repressor
MTETRETVRRTTLFSAKAEYACVAMLEMALHHADPHPVRLKAIAEAHNISQRFLVQILLQLKGAGLVTSTRGAAGGYHLTRSPEQVTLATIIDVIDRPPEVPPARAKDAALPPTPLVQAVRSVWQQITDVQRRILEDTTLALLVKRLQANHDVMYHI